MRNPGVIIRYAGTGTLAVEGSAFYGYVAYTGTWPEARRAGVNDAIVACFIMLLPTAITLFMAGIFGLLPKRAVSGGYMFLMVAMLLLGRIADIGNPLVNALCLGAWFFIVSWQAHVIRTQWRLKRRYHEPWECPLALLGIVYTAHLAWVIASIPAWFVVTMFVLLFATAVQLVRASRNRREKEQGCADGEMA
jgi:hypothetical protein